MPDQNTLYIASIEQDGVAENGKSMGLLCKDREGRQREIVFRHEDLMRLIYAAAASFAEGEKLQGVSPTKKTFFPVTRWAMRIPREAGVVGFTFAIPHGAELHFALDEKWAKEMYETLRDQFGMSGPAGKAH